GTVPRGSCRSQSRSPFGAFFASALTVALAACQYWCASAVCWASSTAATRRKRPRRPSMAANSTPALFRQALFQPGDEQILRQLLVDEDEERGLLLALPPRLAHVAAHHHVYALEDDAARIALHPEDALVAQQIRAVDLDHAREELLELLAVERLVGAKHERLDLVVMLVRDVGKEVGVEFEDGVEIEAAKVQHLANRRVAEMHLLDRRARIHLADAL